MQKLAPNPSFKWVHAKACPLIQKLGLVAIFRFFLKTITVLLVSWAAFGAEVPPSGPIVEEDSHLDYRTPQEALQALQKKPGVHIYEHDGWTVAQDNVEKAVWSFTPANHPAHPSVVKRFVEQSDGKLYVQIQVICGATKESCDALVREFDALTKRTLNDAQ